MARRKRNKRRANCIGRKKVCAKSDNDKTGAMVQTWILPDPHAAGIECTGSRPAKIMAWLKDTGAKSICGDCPHAWQYDESAQEYKKGACYVKEYQSPAAVLRRNIAALIPLRASTFRKLGLSIGAGLDIRAGAYGDPAACRPKFGRNLWRAQKRAVRRDTHTDGKALSRNSSAMLSDCALYVWRHAIAPRIIARRN
jgi:hypothetical protein